MQTFSLVATAIAAVAINALWQDALIVACVWMVLRAWPALNASTRYVAWCAALVAAAIVPLATTLPFFGSHSNAAPAIATPGALRSSSEHAARTLARQPQPAGSAHHAEPAAPRLAPPRFPERLRIELPLPVAYAVFGAWAIFAALALVQLAIGLIKLEKLKRDALPLEIAHRDAMSRFSLAEKGPRSVRLCVSDEIDVPVAVGLFDAMILLPRPLLERLCAEEIDQISLHELAHLRRGDDWGNGIARLIVALLPWNPAARLAIAQLDLEREVACDDWVLAESGHVRTYARCLTKMAETTAWPHHAMPAPGVFATRKQLSLRIERLLCAGRNVATSLSLGPAALMLAAVATLTIAIEMVAPTIAQPIVAPPATPSLAVAPPLPVAAVTPAPASPPPLPAQREPARGKQGERVIQIPAIHVHVPATNVDVHVPATNVDVPAREIAVPVVAPTMPPTADRAIQQSIDDVSRQAEEIARRYARLASFDPRDRSEALAQLNSSRRCAPCDLSGADLSGKDLHAAALAGSDLSGANLSHANLSGATLGGAVMAKADLTGASLRSAQMAGCDLSHAVLTGADFSGAMLNGCQLYGVTLAPEQAHDILSHCAGCDLSHATMSGADISGLRIYGGDLSNVDLRNAHFDGATLIGVDLSHARLDNATFDGATLKGCDLTGVDLTRVNLARATLIGTDAATHS